MKIMDSLLSPGHNMNKRPLSILILYSLQIVNFAHSYSVSSNSGTASNLSEKVTSFQDFKDLIHHFHIDDSAFDLKNVTYGKDMTAIFTKGRDAAIDPDAKKNMVCMYFYIFLQPAI